jgi:broad specificity phosphatase PhoE
MKLHETVNTFLFSEEDMEITLIRHGKSQWKEGGWFAPAEFAKWIREYDSHGVCEEDVIPQDTFEKVKKAKWLIASSLPRAVHSANLLKPSCPMEINHLFREVETPVPLANLPLKLPVNAWLILARIFWLCGYAGNVESYREAKQRAKLAADHLCEYALEHGHVAVIGHGWFNRFLGGELMRRKWKVERNVSFQHWQAITYKR